MADPGFPRMVPFASNRLVHITTARISTESNQHLYRDGLLRRFTRDHSDTRPRLPEVGSLMVIVPESSQAE